MEDDGRGYGRGHAGREFQSTSPVWRTTNYAARLAVVIWISIHVPRVEDDRSDTFPLLLFLAFQSTSPVWRTTVSDEADISFHGISIHVPRVEDDIASKAPDPLDTISIHVPRVEDDSPAATICSATVNFNPRPPCGGRQRLEQLRNHGNMISIHVPRVEDDAANCLKKFNQSSFQSTSPVWRTTKRPLTLFLQSIYFNPRPPCGGRQPAEETDAQNDKISIHVPRVEDDKEMHRRSRLL